MQVKELIKLLETYNPKLEVCTESSDYCGAKYYPSRGPFTEQVTKSSLQNFYRDDDDSNKDILIVR